MPHRPTAVRTAAACATLAAAVCLNAATAATAEARPARPRAAQARSAHASRASHTSHARAERVRTTHARLAAAHAASHRWAAARATAEARPVLPPVPVVPTINLSTNLLASGTTFAAAPAAATSVLEAPAGSAGDTLAGRSGKLRARFVVASAAVAGAAKSVAGYFPYLRRLFGDTAARVAPGVYAAPTAAGRPTLAFITMLPFSQKVAGRVGSYNMGFWPGETSGRGGAGYGNPAGFIEVTADNQATYVSEHFTLGDFLTHDQQGVWPKYLVLHEQLLDKLELVLDDLRAHGYRADRLHVMSGFRTPQYNQTGGDPSGRAELSRHQYGDAADVWVENGGGAMADLNGDGRVDARDAAVLAEAAERVEQAHPELVGGVGIYHGNDAHGPFVHIDTRGKRARWGHA